jgi:hypothetical protein
MSHSHSCVGCFLDRVLGTICPGWLQTSILIISASWVARITGVSCQCGLNSISETTKLCLPLHCDLANVSGSKLWWNAGGHPGPSVGDHHHVLVYVQYFKNIVSYIRCRDNSSSATPSCPVSFFLPVIFQSLWPIFGHRLNILVID